MQLQRHASCAGRTAAGLLLPPAVPRGRRNIRTRPPQTLKIAPAAVRPPICSRRPSRLLHQLRQPHKHMPPSPPPQSLPAAPVRAQPNQLHPWPPHLLLLLLLLLQARLQHTSAPARPWPPRHDAAHLHSQQQKGWSGACVNPPSPHTRPPSAHSGGQVSPLPVPLARLKSTARIAAGKRESQGQHGSV